MRVPAARGPPPPPSPSAAPAHHRLVLVPALLLLAFLVELVAPHASDALHAGLQGPARGPAPAPAPAPALLRTALSPERQGLRPGGSQGLGGAMPALLEKPDRLYDPQPGDLNATLLRAKLGRHFDPRVMSIQRPSAFKRQRSQHKVRYNNLLDSGEDSTLLDDDQVELDEDSPFRRNPRGRLVPAGEMPESIANLDLRGVRLPDGSRLRSRISPRLRRKLQHFLWAYTACPVQRRWRDLGVRFWPRWLREGHCPASPCSIPAGMRCKPAATRHQALLRWHCRPLPALVLQHAEQHAEQQQQQQQQHGHGGRSLEQAATRHCTWIKVEYPIITECSCGCPEDRYS
ncbi:Noggin [Frankliniella fusca]|uniref:Noggin n=1 Tax=Frankliniella fusca TaxID=407009 RepID=A0AAE1LV30_9NEOP|nr:Noggin [Frankliniella fusca]